MRTLHFFLLNITFSVIIIGCGIQNDKISRKERRLQVVRQMVENRNFKVDFFMVSPELPEVPFYMQILGDTLRSFMDYDVSVRPGLEYVYTQPYKHGEPFPSEYIISNYEIVNGIKDSVIVKFHFQLPVNMEGDKIVFLDRNPFRYIGNIGVSSPLPEKKNEFYEVKPAEMQCRMAIAYNGIVVV